MLATVVLAGLMAAASGPPAGAAPGDLDPAFGTGGIARIEGSVGSPTAIAVQPDGRIVAVGSARGATGSDWGLARFRPDGGPDASFGAGGVMTTDFGGDFDVAAAVALQADGRIVVAGVEGDDSGAGRDFALARYGADGALDAPFGSGGRVTADFGGDVDDAQGVAVQPDGRIVVAGSVITAAGGRDVGLVRYLPDGRLDATFGRSGAVTTDVTGGTDFVRAVVLQPDGRIVVAGAAAGDFALVRYNRDGSVDTGFGFAGRAVTDFGTGLEYAYAVALQPDGRIVVTGPTQTLDFALARYTSDGRLDPGFGGGGKVITDFAGDDDIPSGVVVQPDGRIVVAGLAASAQGNDAFDEDFALARYSANGGLDPSFGAGGKVTTDTGGGNDGATAIALQQDGKIVAAGSPRFTLVRYLGGGGAAPTVAVAGGACTGDASARVDLQVRDVDSPAGALVVTAASSDQGLLPSGQLVLTGAADRRSLALSAARGRSGTATVTVSVSDGTATTTLAVQVRVGTPRAEWIAGGDGADVIFGDGGPDLLAGGGGGDLLCGGNGADALSGGAGNDILDGGNGPDLLIGGPGADAFRGGRGPDRSADFAPGQGDTTDGT